jgi:RNA polymerase-binding protein DksA
LDTITADALRDLSERRQALAAHLENAAGEARDASIADVRELSEGSADADFRGRLRDREAAELREINAALARIQAGTYGLCEKCERAIGRQRLRAVPEARLCLTCSSPRSQTAGSNAPVRNE